jgi:hypothetical protein
VDIGLNEYVPIDVSETAYVIFNPEYLTQNAVEGTVE